jgi:adenosylcobyric acid synthase
MIQGTGSSVGKSILVTALCRIFHQDGLSVAPFKSQNMALNSFVTRNGGEMGRSQVVQAEAAGIEPSVDMNPILIKPEADTQSQIVVLGKPMMRLKAGEYYHHTEELLSIAEESLNRLCSAYDLIIIEGAGSPAEINLKQTEIVNMRIAKLSEAPVLLVGDIDKGGVFASLVGTLVLLDEEERDYIRGFIINKFRGDLALLQPGLESLEKLTSKPVIGVIPYYHRIFIPEEDSIYRTTPDNDSVDFIDIAVIYLPHISNSTDFECLQQEEGVRVRYITAPEELGSPDAIILPGSKSTVADLAQLKRSGLADHIVQRAEAGTPVIGICGGFQMLGKRIEDSYQTESGEISVAGLGLLETVASFEATKTTHQVKAQTLANYGLFAGLSGEEITGYEIHMAQTMMTDQAKPAFRIIQRGDQLSDWLDGAVSQDGKVFGTYLHGLFDNANFRHNFIAKLRKWKGLAGIDLKPLPSRQAQYDRLAELVRHNLDMKLIYSICGLEAKDAG